MRTQRAVTLSCTLAAIFVMIAAGGSSEAAQDAPTQQGHRWVPTLPTRRAPEAPPVLPPALPVAAERVSPLTITVTVRHESGSGAVRETKQTITRTADRVHIAGSNRREWLFERNSRDIRRVSGSLIDHDSKTIIRYEETDLRIALGLRGWLDVLTLGFQSDLVNPDRQISDVSTLDGIPFARYSVDQAPNGSPDVWWNEEQFLPSRFSKVDDSGVTHFSVKRISPGTDGRLLRVPDTRFPTYHVIDFTHWVERN